MQVFLNKVKVFSNKQFIVSTVLIIFNYYDYMLYLFETYL